MRKSWVLLAVCPIASAAHAEVLYDVGFAAPFHTPGLPATIDLGPTPRSGPSQNNFSEPIVVSDFGPLTDGALRFAATDSRLSQIELAVESPFRGVGVDAPSYRLDFDVVIDNLEVAADDFAILFDTPQSNRFSFRGDGLIQYGVGPNFIGTFEEGELLRVGVEYLGDDGLWSISVNDIELYSGSTQWDFEGLTAIRLSLDDRLDFDSTVYVDNIRVSSVPGPAGVVLIGLLPLVRGRRRRGLG